MQKINLDKHIKDLMELLRIPSISAQTQHKGNMEKATKWLQKKFQNLGFTADILPTGLHPVVYAEWIKNPDKPTLLIYGHYDVQAPDPLSEWVSEPFSPEIRSGNIYGRGTADDKGQLYTWVAAVDEYLEKNKELPVNIKFLIEGEEELGSDHLAEFIEDNKSLLKADICLISDSHCLSSDQPLITYGLRGLVYTEITVKALPKDVHSGLYGGNVENPAIVLSHIISSLKDKKHKILIPGFYDDVRVLSQSEKSALDEFPFTEHEVILESGAKKVMGEEGFSVPVRAGARPTLDVNGIWGGYQAEGQKTIIPGSASAKISMRLVPNQNPLDIAEKFEKYIKEISPEGVDVEVHILSTSDPILMDTTNPYFAIAEKSYVTVFGRAPLYELSGGSIPVTAILKNGLDMDSILMGYGLPDDGLHSPNEKLSLEMFEKGIKTNLEFLELLKK